MLTLEETKKYLRVDNTAEDNVISTLLDSSYAYLSSAIDGLEDKISKHEGDDAWLHKLYVAQMLLIADWYENRLAKERPVSASVTLLINQLQLD